jgi:tetratricopeptide (TPR) repeat protein
LALQQKIGDHNGAAFSINNLAVQAIDQGDYEKAHRLLDEALQLSTDLRVNTIVLLNYGEVAKHIGDHERAARFQEQALKRSGELGDEWLFCYLSLNLGLTALVLNDPRRAMEWFQGGITRVHRLRGSALLAAYLDGLAALALALGRPEHGARLFGAAIALHNRSDAGLDVSDSVTREATSSEIRAAVGEDAFAQLLIEGGELNMDDAVQSAQEILRSGRANPA